MEIPHTPHTGRISFGLRRRKTTADNHSPIFDEDEGESDFDVHDLPLSDNSIADQDYGTDTSPPRKKSCKQKQKKTSGK